MKIWTLALYWTPGQKKNAWNNCTDLSWKAVEEMLSKRLSDKLGLVAEFLPCVPAGCCGHENRYDTQFGR